MNDKLYSLIADIGLGVSERSVLINFIRNSNADIEFVKIRVKGGKVPTLHMSLENVCKSIEILEEWVKKSTQLRYVSDSVAHRTIKQLKRFVEKMEQNAPKP